MVTPCESMKNMIIIAKTNMCLERSVIYATGPSSAEKVMSKI